MAYRPIDARMWNDDLFVDLPTLELKILWIYLLTGDQVLPLPGLSVAGIASIAEGVRLPIDVVRAGIAHLTQLGRLEFDERRRLLRIVRAPRYNPPANPNVLKGWWSLWRGLPESPLKYRHVESLLSAMPPRSKKARGLFEVWDSTFGTIEPLSKGSETVPETVSEPLPEGSKEGVEKGVAAPPPVAVPTAGEKPSKSAASPTSRKPLPKPFPKHDHHHDHDHDHEEEPTAGIDDSGRRAPPTQGSLPIPDAEPPAQPEPDADRAKRVELEQARADGQVWRVAALAVMGLTPADVPKWGAEWHVFAKARKRLGIEKLLAALDGLTGDQWAKTAGLPALVSDTAITKGLARLAERDRKQGKGSGPAPRPLPRGPVECP